MNSFKKHAVAFVLRWEKVLEDFIYVKINSFLEPCVGEFRNMLGHERPRDISNEVVDHVAAGKVDVKTQRQQTWISFSFNFGTEILTVSPVPVAQGLKVIRLTVR